MKLQPFLNFNLWIKAWLVLLAFIGKYAIQQTTSEKLQTELQTEKHLLEKLPNLEGSPAQSTYRPDELLISFEDTTSTQTKNSLATTLQAIQMNTVDNEIEHWQLADTVVTIGGNTLVGIQNITTYVDSVYPYTVFVEPNYEYGCHSFTPNDTYFGNQWALSNTGQYSGTVGSDLKMTDAWVLHSSSPNVKVAILDTGFDYMHPDLSSNVWTNPDEIAGNGIDDDNNGYIDDHKGYDFYNHDNDPMDDNGHGTHVAGIVGARGNNGIGVAGMTYDVQLMNLKVFDSNGRTNTLAIVRAINYAISENAHILNNSWGGTKFSKAILRAIERTHNKGQLFVAAAGNLNINSDVTPFYPASYNVPNVIAVGASDNKDQKANFSQYGATSVDLLAPGKSIYSTKPGNTYDFMSGTSMAAPFVSGTLALMIEEFPNDNATQLKSKLLSSVDTIPSFAGLCASSGRLNTSKSINAQFTIVNNLNVIYVNHAATGSNNGISWANAFNRLQDALVVAGPGDEIWVAQGTYYTDIGTDRNKSFELKPFVKVVGGFVGNEVSVSQRSLLNKTTLSGNIGNSNISTDNAYHVVRAGVFADSTSVLDGFIIEGGYADNPTIADDREGAGILINGGNPILKFCTIKNNYALDEGGGIFISNYQRGFYMYDCILDSNIVNSGNGGGLAFVFGDDLEIKRCTFRYNKINSTGNGNAMYLENSGEVLLDDIDVSNNNTGTATIYGGVYVTNTSLLTVKNSLFKDNGARSGSSLYILGVEGNILNTDFENNTTYTSGDILFDGSTKNLYLSHINAKSCKTTNGYAGLLHFTGHNLDFHNSIVDSCIATNAGAIYVSSGDLVQIKNSEFTRNRANSHYGGALKINSSLKLNNSKFSYNYAGYDGGALQIAPSNDDSLLINNTIFKYNYAQDNGGAIDFSTTTASNTKVEINSSEFDYNYCTTNGSGGAIRLYFNSKDNFTSLKKSKFRNNYGTSTTGGAIYYYSTNINSDIEVSDCLFYGNNAYNMGALYYRNNGLTKLNNVQFLGNTSLYNGGALGTDAGTSIITNGLFSGNKDISTVSNGGGACYLSSSANFTIINSTFCYNESVDNGGSFYNSSSTLNIINSIIWGNTVGGNINHFYGNANVSYSIVEGGRSGTGNSSATPYFIDEDGKDNLFGTLDDDYRLAHFSSAINAGSTTNSNVPTDDISGKVRDSLPDLGAYEYGAIYTSPAFDTIQCDTISFNLGNDTTVCGNSLVLDTQVPNMVYYNWSTGETGVSNITVHSSGIYAISMIDSCGLIYSDTIVVSFSSCSSLDTGLVAHYSLNGHSLDVSGNQYHGTVTGNPIFTNGYFAKGLEFHDNPSETIQVANFPHIANDISISLWIRPSQFTSGSTYPIIGHNAFSLITGDSMSFTINQNQPYAIDCKYPITLEDTAFYHIVAIYDYTSQIIRLYLNNQLLGSCNYAYPINQNLQDLLIGAGFKGIIDDVRIYNRVLSVSEIHGLYNQLRPTPSIIYVDVNATGTNNGTSWTNAYTDLQTAIDRASVGAEIWVKQGWYYTSDTTNRYSSIELKSGVALYGGFKGDETIRSQRDFLLNPTVISGNIGSPSSSSDNAYHVVRAETNSDSTAILDGFIIRDGYANGSTIADFRKGGGLYIVGGNPTLRNNKFIANFATDIGGGIYMKGLPNRTLYLFDCVLDSNIVSSGEGGGIASEDSPLNIQRTSFSYNKVNNSGGKGNVIYVTDANLVHLEDIQVDSNISSNVFGGIYLNEVEQLNLKNAVFKRNNAKDGSCLHRNKGGNSILENVEFYSNTTQEQGGAIYFYEVGQTHINHLKCKNNIATSTGGVLYISNSEKLTINNVSECLNNKSTANHGGLLYISNTECEVSNAEFKWNNAKSSGSSIYFYNASKNLKLENVTVRGDYTTTGTGGSIYFYGNNLELNNVTLDSCRGASGGAVYAWGGLTKLNNCNIINNTANGNGGGLFLSTMSLEASNNSFLNNRANSNEGGAIYQSFSTSDSSILTDCKFNSNSTLLRGGAIHMTGGANSKVQLTSCDFNDNFTNAANTTQQLGGALSLVFSNLLNNTTILNSKFNNSYNYNGLGGAVYYQSTHSSSSLAIKNSEFIANQTLCNGTCNWSAGGGLAVYTNGTSNIEKSTFIGNKSIWAGGGIYSVNGTINLTNVLFSGNEQQSAVDNNQHGGGGLYAENNTANIFNSTFGYNNSKRGNGAGGGAFYRHVATVNAKNCIFWENIANNVSNNHFGAYSTGSTIINHSVIKGGFSGGTGNIFGGIFFNDALGLDNTPGTTDDDYRLYAGPAINGGDTLNAPIDDLTGFNRTGNPDMGCYEFGATRTTPMPLVTCPPIVLDIGNDTIVCTNSLTLTTGLPNMVSTIWSTGSFSPSITVDSSGVYFVTVIDSCGNTAIDSINVQFVNNCLVFPGDCNGDGIVDYLDLLAVGIAYGSTGPVRPAASVLFYGQSALDWNDSLNTGLNFKHIDCNGDGLIDTADIKVIQDNYGMTIPNYTPNPYTPFGSGNIKFKVHPTSFEVAKNKLKIPFGLEPVIPNGNQTGVYSWHGRIDYSGFGNRIPTLNLKNSIFGQLGVDMQALIFNDVANKRLDIAITRINQNNVPAFGIIGSVDYVIETIIIGEDTITGNLAFNTPTLEDSVGNIIPIMEDSFNVSHVLPLVSFQGKVMLEGAYDVQTQIMRTDLVSNNYLPNTNLIDTSILNQVTDFGKLEIRSAEDSTLIVDSLDILILQDGTITDFNGNSTIEFPLLIAGNYYIVIKHRNHLNVMTASPILLDNTVITNVDFTSPLLNLFGGSNAMKNVNGVRLLYGGDADNNGQIQVNDKNDYWANQVGTSGYKSGDFSLNGQVQINDKNDIWNINVGKGTYVPPASN